MIDSMRFKPAASVDCCPFDKIEFKFENFGRRGRAPPPPPPTSLSLQQASNMLSLRAGYNVSDLANLLSGNL